MTIIHTSKTFSIRLLGAVEVECHGEPVTPQMPKKGLALLAYLVLDPTVPQPRQKLADIFWPDLSAEAARSNLRQVLLGVKRLLDEQVPSSSCLMSDHHTIRFEPTSQHDSDIADFLAPLPECPREPSPADCSSCLSRLETMAHRYRGHFMDNFYLESCPEFEDWLQIQREMLLQRALFLLEKTSDCFEVQRNFSRALVFALRFHELAPWNDEGLRRVIRLAALNGQRGFALSQYEVFCQTLKVELGVLPEAETRKLARCIQSGELQSERRRTLPGPVTLEPPLQRAERRQITIFYCQLAPLNEEDPEDEINLLRAPLARCKEILSSHMGYVIPGAKGEGLLAYFGYPQARENSAPRAVRAALAVVAESFPGLHLRAGVHTALVLSGNAPAQPDIVGRASGLAIGLSSLAGNAEVVISAVTRQLVQGNFDCVDLGPRLLQGDSRRLSCFKVNRPSAACHRLDPVDDLTPLVGREREMTQLRQLWHAACQDEGKVLLLRGEPGIGKSRLVRSLQQALAGQPCRVLELRCSSEVCQSPFQPVINLLSRHFGFLLTDSPVARFAKLTQVLEQQYADQVNDVVLVVAELLSLPVTAPYKTTPLPPKQQRQQTMAMLLDALQTLAAVDPVLLIIEDLHWIDPTTLETLSQLLKEGIPNSVLLLLTARPEFDLPWAESLVPQLTVAPLTDEQVATLIETLAPEVSLARLTHIVERADGVPLFAEELSRTSADPRSAEDSAIPTSLQDLLAARLDRLAEDKGMAQLAATIGRDFSPNLLEELSFLGQQEVIEILCRLKRAGLVSVTAANRWQFRHALFRDAAYLSQTRADREWAHRRIAQILEGRFPDVVKRRPELLAYHWNGAGEAERAVASWIQAGLLAQTHCAHQEALSHFNAGLALLPSLSEGQRSQPLELPLQIGLGASAYAVEGYASPLGAAAYNRAVELGEQGDGHQETFPALWGLWAGASSHSNWAHSLQLAKHLLGMVRNSKDPVQKQQGHFAMGNTQFWRGEFEIARQHLELARTIYEPHHHEILATNYGENTYVTSGSYLAWSLCLLGFPEQAMSVCRQAVAEARRVGHPFSLGYALTFLTVLQRMLREPATTLELAEETLALAVSHDFPLWQAGATLKKGWAQVMLEKHEGLAGMQWSVDQISSLMSGISLIFLETQADGLRQAGQLKEALIVVAKALALVDRLDDHHIEAELYRLQGVCLLGLSVGHAAEAESCFRQALSVSRRQRALLLELRAAMAMASLWARQKRAAEARTLLADVYHRFTEGFDFPDLCAARQLLATLDQQLCGALR